jgi:enoyl-CoA hydratase/carnithine racemase
MSILTDASSSGVMTITFDRPEKKNAFTYDAYRALNDALDRAQKDDGVRCVLLRGAGDSFTSGNDLQDFMQNPPQDENNPIIAFLLRLVRFPKPLLAAVHGHAVGIGTTMLLHCDLVVAARSTRFQLPFVNLGLVPEGGSTVLLPQLCGLQQTTELLLLGRPFDGETAFRAGFVNRLTDDEPFAAAAALAEDVAAQPLGGLIDAKRLIREPQQAALEEAIRREATVFAQRLTSPEAREAFQAFFEKRPPDFRRVTIG